MGEEELREEKRKRRNKRPDPELTTVTELTTDQSP